MLEKMIEFIVSWFVYPDLLWTGMLLGIGLAIAFGAIWFTAYRTGSRWCYWPLVGWLHIRYVRQLYQRIRPFNSLLGVSLYSLLGCSSEKCHQSITCI